MNSTIQSCKTIKWEGERKIRKETFDAPAIFTVNGFQVCYSMFSRKKLYNIINIVEIKGTFNFNTLHSKPLKTQLCTHRALVRLNLTHFLGFNPILGSTFRLKKSDWPSGSKNGSNWVGLATDFLIDGRRIGCLEGPRITAGGLGLGTQITPWGWIFWNIIFYHQKIQVKIYLMRGQT